MTQRPPRRLLLVAADATPRGTATPIRRYRLGQVLMDAEQLIGPRPAPEMPGDRRPLRNPEVPRLL